MCTRFIVSPAIVTSTPYVQGAQGSDDLAEKFITCMEGGTVLERRRAWGRSNRHLIVVLDVALRAPLVPAPLGAAGQREGSPTCWPKAAAGTGTSRSITSPGLGGAGSWGKAEPPRGCRQRDYGARSRSYAPVGSAGPPFQGWQSHPRSKLFCWRVSARRSGAPRPSRSRWGVVPASPAPAPQAPPGCKIAAHGARSTGRVGSAATVPAPRAPRGCGRLCGMPSSAPARLRPSCGSGDARTLLSTAARKPAAQEGRWRRGASGCAVGPRGNTSLWDCV